MRKYQTILNNMITLRAKEELIKTESFESQKHVVENFAMHRNFRYIAKFRYIHPMLDEIDNKPYELGIYHPNFDSKLEMMVKVYETCKTTKNHLETKSVVQKGPIHVNRIK